MRASLLLLAACDEFAAFVRADRARWRAAVNDAGVEPQ